MNRAQAGTLVFTLAVAVVTVTTATVAYRGIRGAFERESGQRLVQLAELAASQLSPADLDDAVNAGTDGSGLFTLQAQLDALRAATGLANVSVLDDSGRVVYDVRAGAVEPGSPSGWDSLAAPALRRVRAGASLTLPPLRRAGREWRAAAVPVPGAPGHVLVTEAEPVWGGELARLRRDLAVLSAVSVLALALLAALVMRALASRLALERRLSQAENLAAMGRMTATLAHEIKNPLAIIRGSARRLARLEPEAQRMADSVVEEVDRLSATVNRYLRFARSGQPVAGGLGDAGVSLTATLDLLAADCRERGCEVVREGDWGPAPVPLDDGSLQQVWLNLAQNALEAQEGPGHLWVRCERAGRGVRVTLRDDGPGVPTELLARLGEPFLTTRAQGTGLGLFLSRRLVEAAGGSLTLASRPGEGTTVTVELPLAAPTGETPAAPVG